jgi:hypothetical protein
MLQCRAQSVKDIHKRDPGISGIAGDPLRGTQRIPKLRGLLGILLGFTRPRHPPPPLTPQTRLNEVVFPNVVM